MYFFLVAKLQWIGNGFGGLNQIIGAIVKQHRQALFRPDRQMVIAGGANLICSIEVVLKNHLATAAAFRPQRVIPVIFAFKDILDAGGNV